MTTTIGTIIGAVISGVFAVIVASKQFNKSMALVEYKIEELKKQVEKHNNVVERTVVLERDLKTAYNRIDEIRVELKEVGK